MLTSVEPMQPHDVPSMSPRLLILAGTVPGEPGVGGVILRDALHGCDLSCVHCCWLAPRGAPDYGLPGMSVERWNRRYETAYRPVSGFAGEVISSIAARSLRPTLMDEFAKGVYAAIERFRPDLLVVVLDCFASIQTAKWLLPRLSVPMVSIVWDDVRVFAHQAGLDRWTAEWMERDVGDVLRASQRVAVICENMQTAYRERYGVESMVLRHGVPLDATPQESTLDGDLLRIGFAGSVTAPDAMRAVVSALDERGWRIGGREVALRLMGARYLLDSRQPQRIEYYGWRSVDETVQLLSECHALYLPQSFAANQRAFSELSFPTKLSTYVAARRPIMLHAPDYASLSGFWPSHPLGPACHSLALADVNTLLEDGLRAGSEQVGTWCEAIDFVHRNTLSTDQFQSGMDQLLGLTPTMVNASR